MTLGKKLLITACAFVSREEFIVDLRVVEAGHRAAIQSNGARGDDEVRVSNLILTLTYEIHDVRTGEIVARKSYDFRGDNDTAWSHAIVYMVQDMKEQSKSASSP